jgi:hypothetical protein
MVTHISPKLIFLSDTHAEHYRAVRAFEPAPRFRGLLRPAEPIPLEGIISHEPTSDDEWPDRDGYPWALDHQMLLHFAWPAEGVAFGPVTSVHAVKIPGGYTAYLEFSEQGPNRVLAASESSEFLADQTFLEALVSSNGEDFGTALMDSAPDSLWLGPDINAERRLNLLFACFNRAERGFGEGVWESVIELAEFHSPAEFLERNTECQSEAEVDWDDEELEYPDWSLSENRRKMLAWYLSQCA